MKERPIPFTGPMVRAILDGRKSQTRRVVKPQPERVTHNGGFYFSIFNNQEEKNKCRYGYPGDRLWVRESYAVGSCADELKPSELFPNIWLKENGGLWYPADNTEPKTPISPRGRTRLARFMPRWASRILLENIDVRVERLQDITIEDCEKEGLEGVSPFDHYGKIKFSNLWESINGQGSWGKNPWVWVIEFRKVEA